ncbi:MAG: YcaO-like family protein [Rhizobiales bacterium]|nr:YcaO-like family protein [Hyphomicrobiales bacterium]
MRDAPDIVPLFVDGHVGRRDPALTRVASLCERMFRIVSPWAPGLVVVGAQADPASIGALPGLPRLSATGSGGTDEEALASCLGEMAERLSLCEQPGDLTLRATSEDVAGRVHPDLTLPPLAAGVARDWREARDEDGRIWLAPADVVFLRPRYDAPAEARPPASLGAAAGRTLSNAREAARFELLERAAALDWWSAAPEPAAALAPADDLAARDLLATWRGQCEARVTMLLALPCAGAACVAAVSRDAAAPRGWAIGAAARATSAAAAHAALCELMQNEIGLMLARVRRKAARPPAAGDAGHLARDAWSGDARIERDANARTPARPAPPIRALEVDLTRPSVGAPVLKLLQVARVSQKFDANSGFGHSSRGARRQGWTSSPPLF